MVAAPTETLVVDSSAALRASMSRHAAEDLSRSQLIGPPLLWSEVYSAVHQGVRRRELGADEVARVLDRFTALAVAAPWPDGLQAEAYALAGELGWAKTFDAEFLALARIEGVRVLTTDGRLLRGAERTGLVIDPTQL